MVRSIKLRWTDNARKDLKNIGTYLRIRDAQAAKRVAARIREQAKGIRESPKIGRIVPEYDIPTIRERIVTPYPYRLVYRLSHSGAEILAIWHCAEDHDSSC